jgi:hypothetical protein
MPAKPAIPHMSHIVGEGDRDRPVKPATR